MVQVLERLAMRRRALRMSFQALADRSGLSVATVRRILIERDHRAHFSSVTALAAALGASLELNEPPPAQVLEEAATAKARRIVGLVQGSSGLEAQAVDAASMQRMVNQTVHELMAGPRSRIWGALT